MRQLLANASNHAVYVPAYFGLNLTDVYIWFSSIQSVKFVKVYSLFVLIFASCSVAIAVVSYLHLQGQHSVDVNNRFMMGQKDTIISVFNDVFTDSLRRQYLSQSKMHQRNKWLQEWTEVHLNYAIRHVVWSSRMASRTMITRQFTSYVICSVFYFLSFQRIIFRKFLFKLLAYFLCM